MEMEPNSGNFDGRRAEQWLPPVAPPPAEPPYAPPPAPQAVPPPYGYAPGQPPYTPPQTGYPPYRAPAPPPFVMPDDPTKPIQVVACRRLNAAQYRAAHKAILGAKPTLLTILLLIVHMVEALTLTTALRLYPKTWETYLFMGLMGLLFIGGITAAVFFRRWMSGRVEKALAAYQDSEAQEGLIELYGDRVVQVNAASVEVIPFDQVNLLVETGDMILIGRPHHFIAWRAEDLTPYDAQLLMTCLQRKIRPGYHRRKAPFYPWLREPLPLPVVHSEDPVWLSVRVPAEDNRSLSAALRQSGAFAVPLLFPVLLMAGTSSIYQYITPYLLLDLLLYAVLGTVVLAALCCLLTGLLYSFRPVGLVGRNEAVDYAFTPKGLAVRLGDSVLFVDKRHITVRGGKKSVLLKTPYDTFVIPWKAVGEPETLKKILSL